MKAFQLGFQNGQQVKLPDDMDSWRLAAPPASKPCIDDTRTWLGCNPTRQLNCPFYANGEKLPGCTTYPRGGSPYKPLLKTTKYGNMKYGGHKPPIDPAEPDIDELDGFSIEEAS
jgi:hypothetical protein